MSDTPGSAASDLPVSDIAPAPVADIPAAPAAVASIRERWFDVAAAPRFALPLLTIACGAAFLVNLGGYPLYTKGEPREAVVVLDMFKGHSLSSFLLPMRAGVEIPSKPLLMHWLIAALSLITGGVGEWTVRLPSAILAIAGVLCSYLYVRKLFNERAALFSALILATNFQYLQAAGGARVDMTLTFFMEVGFFEFLMIAEGLTSRRLLLYVALALAVLAKGPVGVLLPGAVAAVFIVAQRRWSLLRQLDLVKGAIVVAILAGGWYVAATLIGGRAFFDKQVLSENVFTYLDRPGITRGHGHPFYYMELVLLAGFLPWSVLLPFAAARFANSRQLRDPRLLYLVIWIAVVLLFYNFAFSKRGVYLLALYPALGAILGLYLAEELSAPTRAVIRIVSIGMGIFFVLGAGGGLLLAPIVREWPGLARHPFDAIGITAPAFIPALSAAIGAQRLAVVILAAALIAVGYWMIRTPAGPGKFAAGTAIGVICLSIVANLYALPATANTVALKDFALQTNKIVGDSEVAYLWGLNYDVAFYTGRTIPLIALPLRERPQYLILGEDTYKALVPTELHDYSTVLKSGATYLDGTGPMLLIKRNAG
jgi:4-amino-4-deoxy-L-arabinose transferase-like glycosyltransferase